jgi:ATP-binding cassette subfamily F protein 3
MIQVDNLSLAYHGYPLFSQVGFQIQEGERCGFVGRNGSGKSTIFRILTKEETPDAGTVTLRKNYSLGILNQHIRFQKETLLEEAALGLREEEKDCLYKAEKILFGLGFKKEALDRSIKDFSGGYQLRLHLAKVLIAEPNCLLLDEPTNYLDIVSMRWFVRFLKQWKGEFILISHDREFMDSVTTHTMGLHRQKIRKTQGNTVAFYEQLLLEEEIYEKTRQGMEKKRAQTQAFIDRFGAKASKAAQAQSRQKMLSRIPVLEKLKEMNNLDFHFNEAFFPGKKMIEVADISFSYNDTTLIDQLSLNIEKGERIAIVGKNGRGKSTLLRLLAKDLTPQIGNLKYSENLAIGYFGQTNIERLHPEHTAEEEIASANNTLNRTEIKALCGLMMFGGDQADKPVSVLSGGEKSRVLLGKILAKPCNMLFLDEPTHHLDMESIEALVDALEEFTGTVVLVTHSELILKKLAFDKIIVCHQGRQEIFLGDYETFLEKDGWHDAKEVSPKKAKKSPSKANTGEPKERGTKYLEREILQKEAAITASEIELNEINQLLIQEIHNNKHFRTNELVEILENKKKQLEQLYQDLDVLLLKSV